MKIYKPLEVVEVDFDCEKVKVLDGVGDCYAVLKDDQHSFMVAGALGSHTMLFMNNDKLVSSCTFLVDAKTKIVDASEVYKKLLAGLKLTMISSCSGDGSMFVELNNKVYNYFICWLRDHTHTMKGMKYFYSDIKKGVELYADTQREDGMIYDRVRPLSGKEQSWRDYTFSAGNFAKKVFSNSDGTGIPHTVQRIPVENDVEFLFIECLYYTWKASGDTEWMQNYLDNAIKAVNYSMSDEYRWSKKFQLLKRGYTIDTWDFMHKDDSALTLGDNVCDINKTTFGVMFGDNTGMAVGCRYLAEMLQVVGRSEEAEKYDKIADFLYKQLEKISWNGKFYCHHVSEDPSFKRDSGNTDESKQVTLSNAYSLNRKIGKDKIDAIIQTYKNIRDDMPENSPGEYYNCYPPFEKGFGAQNEMWQYMNGGVSTIVAGELARGAFCNGEEEYGMDILSNLKSLSDRHNGHLHVCFNGNPQYQCPFERSFMPIDFSSVANCRHEHVESSDWGEQGNDLKNLPKGHQVFKEIPFDIKTKGVCVDSLSEYIAVPVNGTYDSLYFLHTTDGNKVAAEFEVKYANGLSKQFYIHVGLQVGGWFMPNSYEQKSAGHAPKLPKGWAEYQLAWQGGNDTFENVGTYIWGWNNPYPKEKIDSIVVKASKSECRYLISAVTGCDKPVWFKQEGVSFGIPDAWGAAAVVYAIVEGLAGVMDTGVAFDKAEVTPRWKFAGEQRADVVIRYEASGGYVAYQWEKHSMSTELLLASSAKQCSVRFPVEKKPESITVNGEFVDFSIDIVKKSLYAVIELHGKGAFRISIQ